MNHLSISISIFKFLNKKRKIELLFLLLLIILSSLSEVFTLVSIIPFLLVITDPEKILEIRYINSLSQILNLNTQGNIALLVTSLLIFAAILVGFLRLTNLKCNTAFAARVGNDLSIKAYKKILAYSYEDHLTKNSSEIIGVLITHTNITVDVINYLLTILTSSIISLSILILFIKISGKIAISAFFVFGFSYLIIALFNQEKLEENSKQFEINLKKSVLIAQESLGGIRDVILGNLQMSFINKYSETDKLIRNIKAQNLFIAGFPRFSIESIGIVFLGVITFLLNNFSTDKSFILPTIGSIALGSQRLLPAMQQIYFSWSASKSGFSSINEILKILNKNNVNNIKFVPKKELVKFQQRIQLRNIAYTYQNKKNIIFDDLNLEINKGDRLGIVGKSGSGKSTLINILTGLLIPQTGEIFIDNSPLFKNYKEKIGYWRNTISYVPQDIFLLDSSISANIAFGIDQKNINYEKIIWASKKAKILKFIESLNDGFNTLVGERGIQLSGGQKQRIAIARALYKESQIIIFDESTSAIDQKTEEYLMSSIYGLKKDLTLILVAHRLSTLERCDKICELKNKKVIMHNNLSEYINKKID